jgi:hypothetical protein
MDSSMVREWAVDPSNQNIEITVERMEIGISVKPVKNEKIAADRPDRDRLTKKKKVTATQDVWAQPVPAIDLDTADNLAEEDPH